MKWPVQKILLQHIFFFFVLARFNFPDNYLIKNNVNQVMDKFLDQKDKRNG